MLKHLKYQSLVFSKVYLTDKLFNQMNRFPLTDFKTHNIMDK